MPIELEITDVAEYGKENELIVGTQVSSALKYRDENGRTRLDYPQGSFWGDQVAGIWQDVWLCERPTEYVGDIFAVSDIHKKTLSIKYEYAGSTGMAIAFSLSRWSSTDADEREILSVPCDGSEIVWQYNDGDVELWDIDNPALYNLCACFLLWDVPLP